MSCKQKPNFWIIILTNYDRLGLWNFRVQYEVPCAGDFREEVTNVKIWFLSHSFMANVGAPPIPTRNNPGT